MRWICGSILLAAALVSACGDEIEDGACNTPPQPRLSSLSGLSPRETACVYPDLTARPVDLGLVTRGVTVTATVTVSNIGSAAATLDLIEVLGPGFVLSSSPFVFLVHPNTETDVRVSFTPEHLGVHTGTVRVRTDLEQVLEIPISGTGR
jgi:hypothetical protein